MVAKEIEKFQVSIQTVCQNAFWLGRVVDYIQEDMDAMRNELQAWRQENREHAQALQREQRSVGAPQNSGALPISKTT